MSNVNFLKILKEEKQSILELHKKHGYKNELITEQQPNSDFSQNPLYSPLYATSKKGGEPVNQGLAGDKNREMGHVGGMSDPKVKNFYDKAPSCIKQMIKGTADNNPNKTDVITYQTKEGKSGVQIKFTNGETGLYCMNPNIYYSSNVKQWGGWKCNGETIEGIKGTFSSNVEDTIKSLSNTSAINPSGSNTVAAQGNSSANNTGNSSVTTTTKDAITKTQTSLENAGFSVGSKGADGRVGSDTLTAINQLISKYSELATKQ